MSKSENLLEIRDLHVSIENKEILKGLNLTIRRGEIHALMGPNGTGKSTLANTLMGHPAYTITQGEILFKGKTIQEMSPDERARYGLFLAFQYPSAIPGVTLSNFLRLAVNSVHGEELNVLEFHKRLNQKMKLLEMDPAFAKRYLNDGFSGGEKKRSEILQLAMLEPEMVVLDETDSGLDIDALRIVSSGVNKVMTDRMGLLIITHYVRILQYIHPQFVHILYDGRIVESGDYSLAEKLESQGYDFIKDQRSQQILQEA
ncbi:MAG: Fe-S cluster assembly ATPase SufC [Calditrichaeota bacterium]|nr:Fe-S cluster assembly ATPase SufC [Calditrichota bacterium]